MSCTIFPVKFGLRGEIGMAQDQKKCAHQSCQCSVPAGEEYCSQLCSDAGSDETEIACDCGHPACEQ